MIDALEGARAVLLDAVIAFVLLSSLFVPLELAWPARRQALFRPGLRLDLFYFAFQNLVMVFVALAFNAWLQATVGPLAPAALVHAVDQMPWPAQVILAVVAGDLLLYWGHRACHEIPLLWRFHAVHHSAESLDWVAAHREHPLDGLFSQLCLNLPAFFLGIGVHVVAPLFILRGLFATFVHSNVRIPLGPIGLLFGDPVLHRWHHARVDRCRHNFANVAPYLDVVFRTHYRPDDEDYDLGIDTTMPQTLTGQLLHPFRRRRPEEDDT